MRNTGLYISWITGKEDIIDIDEFEEIVNLVVHQCILNEGEENIYLLGFDLTQQVNH